MAGRAAAPGRCRAGGRGLRRRARRPPTAPDDTRAERRATSLRLEIRDHGRQVVNLRLPLAVGKLALDRIPGLSGEQVERVRAALATGVRGPILEVEDEGESVRIVVE